MTRHIFLPVIQEHPFFCFPESVGWYKDVPEHFVNRIKGESATFNLHIVLSGKGHVEVDGVTYSLKCGDAFLFFPYERQHYYSDLNDPWEIMWVHFDGSLIKEFFMEKGCFITSVWSIKQLNNLKDSILKLLEEAEQFTILHPSCLSTLLYGIISEFIYQAIPFASNSGLDLYSKVISILPRMRELSSNQFSLQYWADKLEISTYYFCKIFKKVTGLTPTKFVTLCRLQKAKQLLIESSLTVKQISIEVGYPSTSYFGRIFMENEGMSPGDYRKRIKQLRLATN